MSAVTVASVVQVPTATPQRVMTRLCKHFAHKTAVELGDERGRIEFRDGAGHAELRAAGEALEVRVQARDAATLEALQGVVERHLKMVEFRDAMPALAWTRAG